MDWPIILLYGPFLLTHALSIHTFSSTVYSTVILLSAFALDSISALDFRRYNLLTSPSYSDFTSILHTLLEQLVKMIHPQLTISKNPDCLQLIYDFLITAAAPFKNAGSYTVSNSLNGQLKETLPKSCTDLQFLSCGLFQKHIYTSVFCRVHRSQSFYSYFCEMNIFLLVTHATSVLHSLLRATSYTITQVRRSPLISSNQQYCLFLKSETVFFTSLHTSQSFSQSTSSTNIRSIDEPLSISQGFSK